MLKIFRDGKADILDFFDIYFRKDADQDLEHLASITGGKTYFVKDGGMYFAIRTHTPFITVIRIYNTYILKKI